MPEFGKCDGGGRRASARAPAPLPALVTTLAKSQPAVLVDISCTGAHLRGSDLPDRGDELMIKIGPTQIFARVVWSKHGECGVVFDRELGKRDFEDVRRDANSARLTRLSPEERQAFDDWNLGLAR